MKSRRFMILAGLSFTTISLLGCARETASQQSSDRPSAESSGSKTPADPSTQQPTVQSTQATVPATILRSGRFVSGEHPTQGTVQIVMQNNQRRLELDPMFSTSTSGPDLVVILHRLPDVIGSTTPPAFPIEEGDYVLLAPLKSYSGAQSYPIPDDLNLDNFQSAAIWCRRFNATFGAATLKP